MSIQMHIQMRFRSGTAVQSTVVPSYAAVPPKLMVKFQITRTARIVALRATCW